MASMAFKPTSWALRTLAILLLASQTYASANGGRDWRWHGDDYDGSFGDYDGGRFYGPGSDDNNDGSSGSRSGSGSGAGSSGSLAGFDVDQASRYRNIHGILAAVAFVVMFPLGATFVRILPGRWALVMHAIAQVLALLLFVSAAALGVWLLVNVKPQGESLLYYSAHRAHPILGLVILGLIFAMPVLGFIHHARFKKYNRRTSVSHVHIWLGRCLVVLGIVNGGIGLKQADASHDLKVGYAIVAAVSGSIWIFFSLFGEWRRRKEDREREAALLAAAGPGGGYGRGGQGHITMANTAPEDGMFRRSESSVGRRDMGERISSDAGTRRISDDSDRPAGHRNKNVRHDTVSEISSRL